MTDYSEATNADIAVSIDDESHHQDLIGTSAAELMQEASLRMYRSERREMKLQAQVEVAIETLNKVKNYCEDDLSIRGIAFIDKSLKQIKAMRGGDA